MAAPHVPGGLFPKTGVKLAGYNPTNRFLKWIFQLNDDTDKFLQPTLKALEKSAEKPSLYQKALGAIPQWGRTRLVSLTNGFKNLPFMKELPAFAKYNLLFAAFTSMYSVTKGTIRGFRETEGGIVSKTIGGIKSGFKSFLHSAGTFFTIAATSAILPKLLFGLTPLGAAGTIVGFIGSWIAGIFAEKALDRFLKPKPKTDKSTDPLAENMAGEIPLQSENDTIRHIDQLWKERNLSMSGPNPWLQSGNLRF